MAEAALEVLQLKAEQCMMIGDSLGTDIAIGNMNNMKTALVLTGNTREDQREQMIGPKKPDYVLASLLDFMRNGEEGNA